MENLKLLFRIHDWYEIPTFVEKYLWKTRKLNSDFFSFNVVRKPENYLHFILNFHSEKEKLNVIE